MLMLLRPRNYRRSLTFKFEILTFPTYGGKGLIVCLRLPPDSPNCMIRHVSEAHNHEFYSHFLLFSTTTKVPTIVQMPKVIKANSKAIRKSVKKAKNIQLAVQAYKDPSSGLSLRAAASLYDCNKRFDYQSSQ
jgi:hypothetical protein